MESQCFQIYIGVPGLQSVEGASKLPMQSRQGAPLIILPLVFKVAGDFNQLNNAKLTPSSPPFLRTPAPSTKVPRRQPSLGYVPFDRANNLIINDIPSSHSGAIEVAGGTICKDVAKDCGIIHFRIVPALRSDPWQWKWSWWGEDDLKL
ncbi:hypothetical protein IFM53868_10091 [Aspergillus udagawae]|uniref:Uncharacterized protein n=1 Tax=Aspergillus udagawae TaxID=91492 RepID=A0ABQ1BD94_9EURO|nr:hypothetical protein IFM53868_10091 [Aspergillus udagawae]